jgi:hypothetical protein
MDDLPAPDRVKYKIGVLADDVMTSLSDRGFMTAWWIEEEE